ncbi:MAG: SGNH/GDSL hydrolase family protein [Opitutaceae bacterium]
MKIAAGQTLLFIGDSITDGGRARPAGESPGLGAGYVSLVDAELRAQFPDRRIRVLNTGISGNRVPDLAARWEAGVLAHRPAWLSVMIGINDVWRHYDQPRMRDRVDADRFEKTYAALLEGTRPQLAGLVLMSPYFLEPDRNDPMRRQMDAYGAIVRLLAERFDALFIDVQAAFDRVLAQQTSRSLSHDRIHPNHAGHQIIARAFLDGLAIPAAANSL